MPDNDTSARRSSTLRNSLVLGIGALAGSAILSSALAFQAERTNPPTGRFVVVDGVRLHYVDYGEGDPVVFFHGNGSMIQDLACSGLLDQAAAHHRVIAFDRPGFGHSERPSDRRWGPSEQAALFDKALTEMGVRSAIIVGHSWGTLVALALALDHPDHVKRLILLSGYYFPSLRADTALSAPGATPLLGSLLQHTIGPVIGWLMSTSAVEHMFKPRAVPDAFWQAYSIGLANRPSQLKSAATETVAMPFAAAALAQRYTELRMPVAIIAGSDDAIVDTGSQSARLHDQIVGSTFESVSGVGHMVHHAVPEKIVRTLDRA